MSRRVGVIHARAARVAVPIELRRALAQLDVRVGRRKAIALAGVGPALFDMPAPEPPLGAELEMFGGHA